ncbi:MAG: primosomal protein N' [Acetatifactor sp.]|nr:primosomal protein N' [Acetatifactor sp.]
MYADVIVDISHEKLDKTFEYRIPENLIGKVEVGSSVIIPFGKGDRRLKGYCVAIKEKCDFDPARIKDICALTEKGVSIEDKMIELAGWIKRNYGGTMIAALKTVLPAKTSVKQLEHKTVVRTMDNESLISLLGECERKHQTAKAKVIRELMVRDSIPKEFLTGKLGISSPSIQSLEKAGAVKVIESKSLRNPVKVKERTGQRKILSKAQKHIVDTVTGEYRNGIRNTYLIRGITGSGKTEVYMNIIEDMVKQGKQAIFLIPEIALTYQTLIRFYDRFGDRVSVMNSTLSPGEKYDQCMRAKNGDIDVIIGPRSALFVPFNNLGIIVVDEEHEGSYKSESTPKYNARETAAEVARINDACLVLGSATPSVDSYYKAEEGLIKKFELNERLTGGSLPTVYTVDMREELKAGNRSIFSETLSELMLEKLNRSEQIILFLNRRGYAGFISCRSCGKVIKCPHCDVSMTEHINGKIVCHYCGYEERKPSKCPECGSGFIGGFKAGTEQIEAKVKEMFPGVRTLRMDGDTTKTKDSYEKILSAFSNGEADVLIGTQMIVKGHDFPNVTLVGVIAADMSLGSGDYMSSERTFQLLTQAVGRAGRGDKPGEAVIQTYQPDHYAVVFSAMGDYESFYREEIAYRDLMDYPPTGHMLAVCVFGKNESECGKFTGRLAKSLQVDYNCTFGEFKIIGPVAARVSKINDIYRFVFYVKSKDREVLVDIKDHLEKYVNDAGSFGNMVQYDFDPVNSF